MRNGLWKIAIGVGLFFCSSIILGASYSFKNDPHIDRLLAKPFITVSIGYGQVKGKSLDQHDRDSTRYRLALGGRLIHKNQIGCSMELGIMNSDRVKYKLMTLVEPDDYVAPNMTLKPPVDLLLGVYGYAGRFIFFVKGGGIYESVQFDYPVHHNKDGVLAEVQGGLGWRFSQHGSMNLYYQRSFGGDPKLEVTTIPDYEVRKLPSLEGVFLSLDWQLL